MESMDLKLKRLSSDIHNPCYLISFHDVNVLLDCCVDLSTMSSFLPSHQLECTGCSHLPTFRQDSDLSECVHRIGDCEFIDAKLQFCLMDKKEFDSVIWDTVDAILISNTRSLLGLPFLCEHTSFRGRILATEPVVKFGKIMIDDILDSLDQLSPLKPDIGQLQALSKQLLTLNQCLLCDGKLWKDVYTRRAVSDALGLIELVAYHEPVNLFGLLTVRGSSSGFGIGSCNWTLSTESEKIAYVSHTSLLYSHVLPFDDAALRESDVLIIGTVNLMASGQLEKTVGEFRHILVQTLARGGHVLVPANPSGLLFDLIETAVQAKENFSGNLLPLPPHDKVKNQSAVNQTVGLPVSIGSTGSASTDDASEAAAQRSRLAALGGTSLAGRVARAPLITISSQIHASLAYANAYGEWLNAERESLLYTADSPFSFQSLLRCNQLYPLRSLHDSVSRGPGAGAKDSCTASLQQSSSPLSFGPDWHSGGVANKAGNRTSSLSTSHASSSSGLSGGHWSGSTPSVIFASHPSLRMGPAVHLLRALVHGSSPTTISPSAGKGGTPSLGKGSVSSVSIGPTKQLPHDTLRHSVILIESGDYISRPADTPDSVPSAAYCLHHLVAPYASGGSIELHTAPTYTCMSLGDSVTCYWLPMDARVGLHQLTELVQRCGMPRLALILPSEVTSTTAFDLPSTVCTQYRLSCGERLTLSLPGRNCQSVHLSARLIKQLRPIHFVDQATSDALKRSSITIDTVPSIPKRKCTEEKQSYVALVDGMLETRDGKHWLKGCDESSTRSVLTATPGVYPKSNKLSDGHTSSEIRPTIYVAKRSRLDPFYLIKQLTERGVTGAYLADRSSPAVQLLTASDSRLLVSCWDKDGNSVQPGRDSDNDDDFILFPNPHTIVQLSDHGSHIITADEGTRKTIRDTLLSCLTALELGTGH